MFSGGQKGTLGRKWLLRFDILYVTKYKEICEISLDGVWCLDFFHNPKDDRVTRHLKI